MPKFRQTDKRLKLYCDQCEMLSINGVACHETGCPNINARFDRDEDRWIKQYKCNECGCMVDAGESCCDDSDQTCDKVSNDEN